MTDLATLGQRIRHFRTERGLTLDQLGSATGIAGSQLSLMENGRREPRLSLLQSIATTLNVQVAQLLVSAPPSPRAALEIELDRMQRSAVYTGLGLPAIRPSRTMSDEVLGARTPSCASTCAPKTTTCPKLRSSPRTRSRASVTPPGRSPTVR
jgi:transcriptional regulator with XRE-family HTH domain